eukprot:Nk52_evm66s343 gene=Nk52_evmTU66s343
MCAMPCKAEEVVENLTSLDEQIRLDSVRKIKNAVIGNKTKKISYMQLGAIPKLIEILQGDDQADMLIQAAAALGSFACGTEQNVYALVNSNAVAPLVKGLSHSNKKVVEACARSLKILYQSRIPPRELIINEGGTVRLLIGLLQKGDSTSESAGSILARCCENKEHQEAVANCGGIEGLVELLDCPNPKAQESALDALASLSYQNVDLSARIVSTKAHIGTQLLGLIKDKRNHIRLLGSSCLSNLFKCGVIPNKQQEIMLQVLPTLVKLCDEMVDIPIRAQAPLVLSHLIEEHEELQKAACEVDAVNKLSKYFSVANINQDQIIMLRRAALLALSSLCLKREESRKLVIEAKILPHVIASLEHPDVNVREAACQCTRSLSRSVKNLRTSLVDAGAALPLFQLLSDSSVRVQAAASATLCNIVLDFSPMKKTVMEQGAVSKLVTLAQSMDYTLRLNSVWALKNLLFQADSAVKEHVMEKLGYDTLLGLLEDEQVNIREQALTLLRNLAYGGQEDIEKVIRGAGPRLLEILESRLSNTQHTKCVEQTLFVVCNIATGNEKHKNMIMENSCILDSIIQAMDNENAAARVAALWCIINLTWNDDTGYELRIERLKELGVEMKLKLMIDDSDLDVKDRVKTALDQFCRVPV